MSRSRKCIEAVAGRCDLCRALVPRPTRCIFTEGVYSGHRYVWKRGHILLASVRCEAHRETETRR